MDASGLRVWSEVWGCGAAGGAGEGVRGAAAAAGRTPPARQAPRPRQVLEPLLFSFCLSYSLPFSLAFLPAS
eukprot:1560161-Rhodomonas_salina.1